MEIDRVLMAMIGAGASAVIAAIISAIKDPVGTTLDIRKKRLDFWKMMLEMSSLTDTTEADAQSLKEHCRQEMAEATDHILKLTNEFVGRISAYLMVDVVMLIYALMTSAALHTMTVARQHAAPQSVIEKLDWTVTLLEVFVFLIGWFWGRWKIRDWVWAKVRPGQFWDFLLRHKRLQALAELLCVLSLLLPLYVWIQSTKSG
jgi:hypothetical protein